MALGGPHVPAHAQRLQRHHHVIVAHDGQADEGAAESGELHERVVPEAAAVVAHPGCRSGGSAGHCPGSELRLAKEAGAPQRARHSGSSSAQPRGWHWLLRSMQPIA